MKTYILKLNSGVDYKLYDGATLVSDADLATLFATAGEGYFTFDFNSGTPSAFTNFTISDSNDAVVITQVSATVAEGPNYKGTWSASATAFDTFDKLGGVAMDEAELSFLMGETKKVEDAAFVGSVLSTPSSVAYVATDNIQDGAVTSDKIDYQTLNYSEVSMSYTDINNVASFTNTAELTYGTVNIARSSDSKIFRVYGKVRCVPSSTGNVQVRFVVPTSTLDITERKTYGYIGIHTPASGSGNPAEQTVTLNLWPADNSISIDFYAGQSSGSESIWMINTILFQ